MGADLPQGWRAREFYPAAGTRQRLVIPHGDALGVPGRTALLRRRRRLRAVGELPDQRTARASRPRHRDGSDQESCGRSERIARTPRSSDRRKPSSEPPTRCSAGALRDQFVVDVYQAGAGTSHNMNANEVLANRAAELLGEPRGATRACIRTTTSTWRSRPTTSSRRRRASRCCSAPSRSWSLPRSWPQSFDAKARKVRRRPEDGPHAPAGRRAHHARPGIRRLRGLSARGAEDVREASEQLRELNLGATAVGTGLNAGDDYRRLVVERLAAHTALPLDRRRISSA